MNMKPVQQRV